ncbi:MAG: enoyl-CoA hydratase-related protein [Bacteroidales bacterium]|nr:enoyl-CoA hydratase-related protein [Bacteroidales bacterium]
MRKFCMLIIENRVAILSINKIETLNSLNIELLNEIYTILENVESDSSIDILIITGIGKSFIAGADIKEMSAFTQEEALEFGKLGWKVFDKIENLGKVVIAAVNGYAIGGGCELTLACDIRIASEKAVFSQPELSLGIIPGFSGTQRLPKIVGMAKAKELIFTGDRINAEEALKIGLVNKVVSVDNLINECLDISNRIVLKSQFAIKNAKKSINQGYEESIEIGRDIETNLFSECFEHPDQKEGMGAFIEKRNPKFNN